jgi:excisionase family DNA binding protein
VKPYVLTVAELASRWACSRRHVYGQIESGRLGHIRIGSLIRIRMVDIEEYEARNSEPAATPAAVVVPAKPVARPWRALTPFERGQQFAARQRDGGKS